MLSFLKNNVLKRVMNAVAAGTTDQNSSSVDMSDAECVTFVAALGTISANAVTGLKVQQSDDDGSTDGWSDLEGSLTTLVTPTTDNNKLLATEVVRPTKKTVRAVVTRATGNVVIDGVFAIKSHLRVSPATHDATVLDANVVVGPAEGTA